MNVNVKQLEKSRVEISVTLSWDEWKQELDHAVEHLAQSMDIKGFRKGKIPRSVIESRIGKNTVLLEGAEHAVDHTYPRVLEEAKVTAIGRPEAKLGNVAEGESLEYTIVTAVLPDIEFGDWEKAAKKVNAEHSKKASEVKEQDIDDALRKLADSRAKYVTVDRPAQDGDLVEVDFFVTQNGVPIENGSSRKHPVVLGKGAFISGFEEELLGMSAGEEKTFPLSFPSEYHAKHLAGRSADFRVKALLVQKREVPVIDDAFAVSLGNFENLVSLRKSVSNGLLEEEKAKKQEEHRVAIIEAILSETKAELPEVLVESELDRMISEFEAQTGMMGMNFDDFLAQAKKTRQDFRNEWRSQAEKRILSSLALEKIAENEEVHIEQQEIEEEMNRALAHFKSAQQAEKSADLPALYTAAESRLRNKKVFERLESL